MSAWPVSLSFRGYMIVNVAGLPVADGQRPQQNIDPRAACPDWLSLEIARHRMVADAADPIQHQN
jgi:hypothetical protein